MCGAELDVDREAERAGEEEAMLGPDDRARDLDLLPARADDDARRGSCSAATQRSAAPRPRSRALRR